MLELRIYRLAPELRWNWVQQFRREHVLGEWISFRDDDTFVSLHDGATGENSAAQPMVRQLEIHRLAPAAGSTDDFTHLGDSTVLEIRLYRLYSGTRARFAEFFRTRAMDALERGGMRVYGQYDDLDDENLFIWFRGFPDLAERDRRKAKFYQGEFWLNELQDEAFSMIADYSNVLLVTPVTSP
jgi:hypothetical protein